MKYVWDFQGKPQEFVFILFLFANHMAFSGTRDLLDPLLENWKLAATVSRNY